MDNAGYGAQEWRQDRGVPELFDVIALIANK